MRTSVQINDNYEISAGFNGPKILTKESNVTSNRTVVGFQIKIFYNENEYDIVAYKKNEIKEFTYTLALLKSKIEELKAK
ncbi:MAG: hypothetical protein ACXWW0_13025 [Bacteroidia bacterium]